MADAVDQLGNDQDDVMTVAQINGLIADQVNRNTLFADRKVIGEVTNCSTSTSGIHFDLTDGDHRISCLLWHHRHDRLDVDLDNGMEVIVRGRVDYWEVGGDISFKSTTVTLVGEGDQHAALERRQRLADRGWFKESHKQPLPLWPSRVGIVTSRDGDARADMQTAIHARHPDVDIVFHHLAVWIDRFTSLACPQTAPTTSTPREARRIHRPQSR